VKSGQKLSADAKDQQRAAVQAIREATDSTTAADPKGLDKLAQELLRPELLIYGAITAELGMRGMLPGVQAMRRNGASGLDGGVVVTGRDLKRGVVQAVRGTQTCVNAVSSALERTLQLPSVLLCSRPSHTPAGALPLPHCCCIQSQLLLCCDPAA
jgi:hypothetical protein